MRKEILILVLWTALGIGIAALAYITGPFFQFSYFFIIPVGLASWYSSRIFGMVLAALVVTFQCLFFRAAWITVFGSTPMMVNLAMQFLIFAGFAELIHRIASLRRFHSQMLESLPVGMWVLDRTGRLLHTNLQGLAIWGGNPKEGPGEAAGPRLWIYGTDVEVGPEERPVMRALKKGEASANEVLEIQTCDGTRRVISSSAAPVLDQKGRIQGAVVVNKDITIEKRLEKEKADLFLSLQEARKNIKILSGLLPICANCKKIRDDHGAWEQLEQYIHSHSEAEFSHGICPDCVTRLYPEYASTINPE